MRIFGEYDREEVRFARFHAAWSGFLAVALFAMVVVAPDHEPVASAFCFIGAALAWTVMMFYVRMARKAQSRLDVWMGDGLAYREAFHQLPPEERKRMLFGERPQ